MDHRSLLCTCLITSLWLLAACSGQTTNPDQAMPTDAGADAAQDTGIADVDDADHSADQGADLAPVTLRVATFNASLFRATQGQLVEDLSQGDDAQARQVAELLQRVRPDIVLINEFDWDADGQAARLFAERYLSQPQNGAQPLDLAHWYVPPTNTGEPSGVDLNQDGAVTTTPGSQAYGNDAYGFGLFPGQYGMVVYSRFPLQAGARTFQTLAWSDMPDNLIPTDWYSAQAAQALRLSSKNHIDLPIEVQGHTLHILASHPTPPSFDGAEDRNGRRNHDEVRFWVDYITPGQGAYIHDDAGQAGGAPEDASFVILGDLNSDPVDADSRREALTALLSHPKLRDPQPTSAGAVAASQADGRANTTHAGAPEHDTADFSDNQVGNLRVDYALPSANLVLEDAGVFWPAPTDPLAELARVSDHHLVWVDVTLPGQPSTP